VPEFAPTNIRALPGCSLPSGTKEGIGHHPQTAYDNCEGYYVLFLNVREEHWVASRDGFEAVPNKSVLGSVWRIIRNDIGGLLRCSLNLKYP